MRYILFLAKHAPSGASGPGANTHRRRPTRADTARPPLVLGHGLGSRPLCLAIADKHLWPSLELGKDLARTWQEIGSSECLKQPEFVFGGLGGDLGRLGSI